MAPPLFRAAVLTALMTSAALGATNGSKVKRLVMPPAPGATGMWKEDISSVPLNSPGIIERGLCLTIGLTKRAAYSCGDLVVAYELPYVRVLGKRQAPTLVYSSQLAHPTPLITLEVATPGGTDVPDSIRYVVKVNGNPRDSLSLDDSLLTSSPSTRRRIQVGWDARNDETDVYSVDVDAIPYYAGAPWSAVTSISTEVIVVNRWNSPIGLGWWVGGVEKLSIPSNNTANRLWVGGNGSARIFRYRGTANVWTADSLDGPDTLTFNGTNYERKVSGGARVVFNAQGQHINTIDSRGFTTTFRYKSSAASAPLDSVTLPKLAKAYQFVYTGIGTADTTLDKVYSPKPGGVTTNEINTSGPVLYQIFDAAGTDEYYEVVQTGTNAGRIKYRRERGGSTSTYWYDNLARLWRDSVDMYNRSDITTICPFFILNHATCGTRVRPVATALVTVDGPRPNSPLADTSAFRVGRFGAPSWTRNAVGDTVNIYRDSLRLPAFISQVRTPDGTITRSTPDARGNVATMTVENALNDGVARTTSYVWDQRFDAITKITQPLGDSVKMSYDADGNLEWREDGRGSSSRVGFQYGGISGNDYKLLYMVRPPATRGAAVDFDYLTYDALGNPDGLYQYTDSTGGLLRGNAATHFTNDAIGRAAQTCVDVDSIMNPVPPQHCTYTIFDRMGRDSVTNDYMVAYNTIPVQGWTVTKIFGNEGDVAIMAREKSGASGVVYRSYYERDRAGNVLVDSVENQPAIYMTYDGAGNMLTRTNRRGQTVTMTYDGLSRLVKRVVPGVSYSAQLPTNSIGDATSPDVYYPWTTGGGGYAIAADTTVMTYDVMSRLSSATNKYTQINRTYYPNGLLRKDSLRVQGTGTGVYQAYGLENRYDGNNRRTSLRIPSALLAGSSTDSIGYQYIAATNELWKVTDPNNQQWTYEYTLRGDVSRLTSPGSRQQNLTYTDVGNVLKDELLYTGTGATLRRAHSKYDPRGKRLSTIDSTGFQENSTFKYSGVGHAISSHVRSIASCGSSCTATFATAESPRYDPFGNITTMERYDTLFINGSLASANASTGNSYTYDSIERLTNINTGAGAKFFTYDADGNVEFYRQASPGSGIEQEDRFSFYGADDRLMAADYRAGANIGLNTPKYVFEQFRYDALGRRVWVRTDKECDNSLYGVNTVFCDMSTLRRTVWDGDAELMEIQVPVKRPGNIAVPDSIIDNDLYLPRLSRTSFDRDPNPYFGRTLFITGAELDRPIGMVRYNYTDLFFPNSVHLTFPASTVSLLWDTKGSLANVSCSNGADLCTATRASAPSTQVAMIFDLPGYWFAYERPKFLRRSFQGTLTMDKEDATRTNYRRNRYYDPASGRFTQEDPVRFAGGLSLYGFGGGDAVGNSDPFGLCDDNKDGAAWCAFVRGVANRTAAIETPVAIATAVVTAPLAGGGFAVEEIGGAAMAVGAAFRASSAAKTIVTEGIYVIPVTLTTGLPYVGQSGNITARLAQHVRSGKLAASDVTSVIRMEVRGGKLAREIAEQRTINSFGGIKNLDNKINALGPNRIHLAGPPH